VIVRESPVFKDDKLAIPTTGRYVLLPLVQLEVAVLPALGDLKVHTSYDRTNNGPSRNDLGEHSLSGGCFLLFGGSTANRSKMASRVSKSIG